ncbi:MAG: CHAT domain-containing tetratricopeptide repeat protein [Pseudomonadota bacterium]
MSDASREVSIPPDAAAEIEALREAADAIDGSADPQASIDAWIAARDKAAEYYPEGHPEIAALTLETTLGHFFLGDLDQAVAITESVIPILRGGGEPHLDALADAYNALVVFRQYQGRFEDAYPVARDLLDLRRFEYDGVRNSELAAAYSNMANLEFEFGNVTEAIDLIAEAVSITEDLETIPPNAAPYYGNQVVYLLAAGWTERALDASRLAAERHQQILPPGHPYQAQNLTNLANLLLETGRPSEAEAIARRAVDIAAEGFGRDNHQSLYYLKVLADTLKAQGRYGPAETLYAASAEGLTKALGPEADRTLQAAENLALLRLDIREDADALQTLRDIQERRRESLPELHRERLGGAWRLAQRELAAGNLDAARALAEEASRAEAQLYDATDPRRLSSGAFSTALTAIGGDREAIERGIALNTQARRNEVVFSAGGTSTFLDREAHDMTAGWLLEAALAHNDVETALLAAQQLQSATTRQAVARALERDALADPAERSRLRAWQDQVLRRQQLFFEYASAVRSGAERLDADRIDELREDIAIVERSFQSRDRATTVAAARPTLAQLQSHLGEDEALVLLVDSPLRPVRIIVTRESADAHGLEVSSQTLQVDVDQLRSTLDPQRLNRAFDDETAQRLFRILFDDDTLRLLDGRDRLLVAASGPLSALPLHVLKRSDESWLMERFAVVTLPSTVILAQAPPDDTRPIDDIVLIGAPAGMDAIGESAVRSGEPAQSLAALPALAFAETELRALAEALPSQSSVLLTGPDATKGRLIEALTENTDMLAFATHGLVSGEFHGVSEPSLLLTPQDGDEGLLSLTEVTGLSLNGQWVVLSACNTAAGAQASGDGLTGLVSAFLYAGADRVLATHWPVRDDMAATLTTATLLGTENDPAENLQTAMQGLAANPDTAHPALWSPMIYVGR